MRVAISMIPRTMAEVRLIAAAVERHGIERLGIPDSPRLYRATYPAVQEALAATSRLLIGPFVTNPVTRHPSVHASNLAALDELHPGRVGIAIGAGDSAVTSVGLVPAGRKVIADSIRSIRRSVGEAIGIEMAVSGPLAADAVPAEADGVVLGSGLSPSWAAALHRRAERAAGHPLSARVAVVGSLIDDGDDPPRRRAAERAVRASVLAYGRHGIGRDPIERGVPAAIADELSEVFAAYRMDAHAKIDGANAGLLDDHPAVEAYLVGRYALVGTGEEIARRLARFGDESGIDGVSISINVPDPFAQIAAIGDRLLPHLNRQTESTTPDAEHPS